MAAYVGGDHTAFRALFDRYATLLFRLARRRVASDDEARDIVQQVFLQLHRARHDFRADSRLRPWLFTIAMNVVREHHRRRGRRREQVLAAEAAEALAQANHAASPEAERDRVARVRAALATLPEGQREVIELHWFEECSYEEIAQIVGASVAAVRVRAHRGYEQLRRILPRDE